MAWYDERDPKLSLDQTPRKRDWNIKGQGFKAKGHGAWAWKKGMRANRPPKYVLDHRDERLVWMRPTSKRRRGTNKALLVNEALRSYGIDGRGVIEIPADA